MKDPMEVFTSAPGHWLPPKRWKTKLYGLLGLTAPDRWIPHHPKTSTRPKGE